MKADIWSVGVVLYQMIFGKCPFESKSIAKLIKMLEEDDVRIPDTPKISPTLDKLLRRILVKDYNNRLDWKELFEYTVTETGEIYPPGVTPGLTPQYGLRNSIRNSTGYGVGNINFNNNNNTNNNNSSSSYASNPNINSPMISPKMRKDIGK